MNAPTQVSHDTPKMSEHINWNPMDGSPPKILTRAQPTLAELRAKVTEAEAAYGREELADAKEALPNIALPAELLRPTVRAVYAAREALRKAEEAERKPRLRSIGEITDMASTKLADPAATGSFTGHVIRATRADMITAIRALARPVRLETAECKSLKEIYLSDIEALVREAGE